MTFEVLTPVVSPLRTVPAEWIDYNGHMNVGYYSLAFDKGVDVLLDLVGVGAAFTRETRMGPYVLQNHLHYLDEVLEGETFRIELRVLDCDAKRFHLFAEMRNAGGGVAATSEQLATNVDLETRRSAPYPDWAVARFEDLRRAHAGLPRPAQAGASIGIRRKA